jgi:FAD/FMN-containing dehydrogenase
MSILLRAHFEETHGRIKIFPKNATEWLDAQQFVHSLPAKKQTTVSIHSNLLTAIDTLDEQSMTIDVQTGIELKHLEDSLNNKGFTLGPLSPLAMTLTLKDFLEGPLAGLRSIPMGRVENVCTRIHVVTREGLVFETSRSPRSAAGPDLLAMYLGNESENGSIVEATIRIFERPFSKMIFTTHGASLPSVALHLRTAISHGCHMARVDLIPMQNNVILTQIHIEGSEGHLKREHDLLGRVMAPMNSQTNVKHISLEPERETSWSELIDTSRFGTSLFRISLGHVLAASHLQPKET